MKSAKKQCKLYLEVKKGGVFIPGGFKKINEYNESLTAEERKNNARKAGSAPKSSYGRKKTLKELAQIISDTPVSKNNKKYVKDLGIEDRDATNNALVVAGVFNAAAKGFIPAVEKWEQLISASDNNSGEYKLPAEVLGKAFVDINRHIEPNYEYVFEGGRGGLKSSYISLKIIELIKNNPNMHACIVRAVAATLKDSVYAQMLWAINALGLNDEFKATKSPLEITYEKTGQKIYFRGCDDPMKLKGIKPTFGYVGILWKEEKDQLKGAEEERSVNQSVLRGGDVTYDFSSYNPPKSSSHWVYKEKQTPKDKRVIHKSNYLDAPTEWLGQKFIDDAEHLKAVNPTAYDHEYMGNPTGSGTNVFDNLEVRKITDEEIKRQSYIYQGVDWGFYPDPFVFIRVGYEKAQETIYLIDEIYENKLPNSKSGQMILDKGYDDYEITCDSAEPKSINDYRDMGLPARGAVKGAGSVEYGMKFLQIRKIVVDPERTPKTYQELINYEYEKDKNGDVISGYPDKDNHAIDAMRYALERVANRRGDHA